MLNKALFIVEKLRKLKVYDVQVLEDVFLHTSSYRNKLAKELVEILKEAGFDENEARENPDYEI